jgi:DNA repair photolyase
MKPKQAYDVTYQQLFNTLPPASVTFGESEAEIISQGRGFVGAFDLTMQLQVGCPGGCLFCYVPAGERLTPSAIRGPQGRDWGFQVRNKRNILQKFDQHLANGDLANKTIYWSGVTDPYVAPPAITQTLWQTLCNSPADLRPRRIVVQTRFRPDRDVNLMEEYYCSTPTADQGPPVLVSYSIGTDRDDLIRAWERATPPFGQRMKSIQTLRQAGIFVVATLSPFGLWNNLQSTLEQFKVWGVSYLTCLFFKENTHSANTPLLFLAYLRKEYPILLNPAWQSEQVREMKAIYGEERVLIGKAGFTSLVNPHRVTVP